MMKALPSTTTFLILLLLLGVLTSANAQNALLVSRWKLEEKSVADMLSVIIDRTKKANLEQAKQIEQNAQAVTQVLKDAIYEYKENGVFEVTTLQGVQSGTWKISGKDLITQLAGSAERKDYIISLSAAKLTVYNSDSEKTLHFIHPSDQPIPIKPVETFDIEKEKSKVLELTESFKKAIINKDSLALKKLFFKERIVWIAVAHQKSFEFIKKFDASAKEIDQQGAFQLIKDPQYKTISMEEVFKNPEIQTDGRIASLSFDYAFKFQGAITNWGKENWQLVKDGTQWVILNLVYSYHLNQINPAPSIF